MTYEPSAHSIRLAMIAAWNTDVPIGTEIRAWSDTGKTQLRGRTRTLSTMHKGEPVVWIENQVEPVPLIAIDV